MSTEKYIGEAALKDKPQKKLSLVIREGSVNTNKLADKAITIPKIADDVWKKIANDIDYSDLSPDHPIRWAIDHSCLWQISVDDSEDVQAAKLEAIKSIPSQFRVLGCVLRIIGTEDDRVIGTYKYTYNDNRTESWEDLDNWELIPTYAEVKKYIDDKSTDIKDHYLPLTGGTLTGKLIGTEIEANKFNSVLQNDNGQNNTTVSASGVDVIYVGSGKSAQRVNINSNKILLNNSYQLGGNNISITNRDISIDNYSMGWDEDEESSDTDIKVQTDSIPKLHLTADGISLSDGQTISTTVNKDKVQTPLVEADNAKVSIIDTTRIKNDGGDNVQINKPFVFTTDDSEFSTTINTDGSFYMYDKSKNKNFLSITTLSGIISDTGKSNTLAKISSNNGIDLYRVQDIYNTLNKIVYTANGDYLIASHFQLRNGTESQLLAGNGSTTNPIDDNDINNLFN